ncbi:hypothetical protein BU16DRAFT_555787 [Lophium mytilinum]|uniref:Uncharacterized protein n=1 Tax=Lophium mytilinum TaxID=390894 RepID=A0A6A6RA44_9PEZI|nr:hypothetical protein BU16DRAFT_555787 [Lophium mytilinum]
MAKTTHDPSPSYESVPNIARTRGTTQGSRPRMRGIQWWTKLVPFYVIIPVAVSLAIEILHIRLYKNTESLYRWSTYDRTSVQVIVHILSTILAILLVYPVCTVLSFWTRHRLSRRDVGLNRLRLWSAMVQGRLDWSLPWLPSLLALGFFALTYLPAAVWAGALTPVLTVKVEHNLPFHIPAGGPGGDYALSPIQLSSGIFGECWTALQSNGTFTNCPQKYDTGNLLQTIASATSSNMAPRNHSKWDNTDYQYIGLSYGVGAATGLTDDGLLNLTSNVQGYNYTEIGLITKTSCIYNESATWRVYEADDMASTPPYQWYYASGQLPNSDWSIINISNPTAAGTDFFYQLDFKDGNEVVATLARPPISRDFSSGNGQWFFGLAALNTYKELDKIQCEMKFVPTRFLISASTANRTITVTPVTDAWTENLDAKGKLRARAVSSMGVSYIVLSLYTSVVGNAFMENVHNM